MIIWFGILLSKNRIKNKYSYFFTRKNIIVILNLNIKYFQNFNKPYILIWPKKKYLRNMKKETINHFNQLKANPQKYNLIYKNDPYFHILYSS